MNARQRILGGVRAALANREAVAHPGAFTGARPPGALDADPIRSFTTVFTAAGGEVADFASRPEARAWMDAFAMGFDTVAVGATVPVDLAPSRPMASASDASLAVSRARCAVAETGSLVLDARDGRRTQLMPPTHLVWIDAEDVHETLIEALRALGGDLPSALGLHSGPSKSADIGQILVRGVHGPGRVVAGLIRPDVSSPRPSAPVDP